ncbi:hypothetical protein NMG60_11015159 [Bertholletia excelsa]
MYNSSEANKQQSKEHKWNGTSLWGFLLSLFIYVYVFYIFKLSPYSIFNSTMFWFFISNTLILIILTDFGAFSSSRKPADLHQAYLRNSQANTFISIDSQYPVEDSKEHPETIKEVFVVRETESHENKLETFQENDSKQLGDQEVFVVHETESQENELETFQENDSKQLGDQEPNEEGDEFSNMSNEELNRRVEEFIEKFNRQIQLQKAQNRINQI